MNELEEFLRGQNIEGSGWAQISYDENTNQSALTDKWLKERTSYIWKVGVLSVVDGNKADWAILYIGIQRSDDVFPEFIGRLHFPQGENDDPGRVLKRMLDCAACADGIFDDT